MNPLRDTIMTIMPGRAEQLFHQLTNAEAICALIGQSEDVHFDCKEWPAKDEDAQKVFAKAACGLANAEGGVLVVGMKARTVSKDEPDLVSSTAPVADTSAVKSKILDLVGQLVEPGIEGIEAVEVNEPKGTKSGFVIVHIPASEGSPKRSRKDWKFYLRIGSGTIPMEYFQIADMFGKRPQPKLELYLEPTGQTLGIPNDPTLHRFFWIGLSNTGRGLAKFPSVRFKRADNCLRPSQFGLDGNSNLGLPQRPSDKEWLIFRGGVDDVIYPGTTLKITQLLQRDSGRTPKFDSFTFTAEVSCEGLPTTTVEKLIPSGLSQSNHY
jgi:Putative DNA-binding domain